VRGSPRSRGGGARPERARQGPGEPVELSIERLGSDGAGVGRLPDGRVVFIHRTAPGDRVLVHLEASHPRWARGRLDRVLEPGAGRATPPCPKYSRCGGCTLQHVDTGTREGALRQRIVDAFERIGKLEHAIPPLEFHSAPAPVRYRNRATFTLRRLGMQQGSPRVVAGFHALESPGHIVDVGAECLLLEEPLAALWARLRGGWGENARLLPSGAALRLTLRTLSDGSGVLLVEGGGAPGDPDSLLPAVPGLRSVWHASAAGGDRGPRCLAGDPAPVEQWFGESLVIEPGAFLQVNRRGAEALHARVMEELAEPDPGRGTGRADLLDAYCGFGVYGRAWARKGFQSVGIELDERAARMASEDPVPHFSILTGAVEDRIAEALPARQVILNPPRTGADARVMEAIREEPGVERIVYVSCDPATLARDLSRLGARFRPVRLQALDLFPQTAHVETVVTLETVSD
jgi:23S rRNA (uracil1939-C5)-methyltransferase